MSLELIAVQGCTIGHGAGSPISGGIFVITTPPSVKVSAEGKPIFSGPISFTFSGGNITGGTPGTVVCSGTIAATATSVFEGVLPVLREGYTGTMVGTATNAAPPPPTIPAAGPVEISVAGQTSVKAQ